MSNNLDKSSKRDQIDPALKNIPKTLIVGYGNPDREDDGVAWHVLRGIAGYFDIKIPSSLTEDLISTQENLQFLFNLQLMPEMTYEMANFSRICFVDAHTGALRNDLNIHTLERIFQNSPLTHHMTPQTILSILDSAFNHQPEAILVSVRGYKFGFSNSLSTQTKQLSEKAIIQIINWILNK